MAQPIRFEEICDESIAVACKKWGGANGATAPGIKGKGASKEGNYKNINPVTR